MGRIRKKLKCKLAYLQNHVDTHTHIPSDKHTHASPSDCEDAFISLVCDGRRPVIWMRTCIHSRWWYTHMHTTSQAYTSTHHNMHVSTIHLYMHTALGYVRAHAAMGMHVPRTRRGLYGRDEHAYVRDSLCACTTPTSMAASVWPSTQARVMQPPRRSHPACACAGI
jgi:hypothetical protein